MHCPPPDVTRLYSLVPISTLFRSVGLGGRAGPWGKEPEYQKPGRPPFGGSGARMILLPEPLPFEKAERALWGQKWTAGEADKLRDLIGWGEAARSSKEAGQ